MITVVDVSGATRSVPIISSPADTQIAPFVGSKDRVLRLQNRIGERWSADGYFVAESDLVIGRAINAGHQLVVCVVHERRSTPLPFAVGSDASVVAITSELAMTLSGSRDNSTKMRSLNIVIMIWLGLFSITLKTVC